MNARVKLSSKGQIVLPKAVRDAHGLKAGSEVELVDDGENIVLRPVRSTTVIKRISMEEFLAKRTRYDGPPITDEMMRKAIDEEARRRWNAKNRD